MEFNNGRMVCRDLEVGQFFPRSLSDSELKSSIISDRCFHESATMHRFGAAERETGRNSSPRRLRNVRIWFLLLVLNLFCQGVEPFEVKGDTNEIPLAFNCVQPA